MRLWSGVKSLPTLLRKNKSKIVKRTLIYLIILLVLFPFVFINRITIYKTFLTRYDDWYSFTNEDGIPITDYGYQAGVYVGQETTVRMVANLGISYYNLMIEGNSSAGIYFNNTVDWILSHRQIVTIMTENGTVQMTNWPYDFAVFDLPKGWISSMVEAKSLQVLALAYDLYGNETYLEIFEQIATTFETPTSLGGDLFILEDGTHWYPEIILPSEIDPNYDPPLILNGFLIALHHIYQANLILNNSRFTRIFNLGAISAAQNLYKYDLTDYKWTLYHLEYPEKLASTSYHQIHINYCNYLYEYTNVTIFNTYAERWASYTNRPSFTINELLSPEFIQNGALMVFIILGPLLLIDFSQHFIQKQLRKEQTD